MRDPRTGIARKARLAALLVLTLALLGPVRPASAQDVKAAAPKVLIEGAGPDATHFRTEIAFVNHVDRTEEAQVVVTIVPGPEFSLTFTGRAEFEGVRDVLTYRPAPGEKPEDVRRGLTQTLKLGLIRFVTKTPIAGRVEISFLDQVKPTSVVDPWNFWVFSLSANGMLNGEKTYQSQMWFGNFSASRVTPEWKVRLGLSGNFQKDAYNVGDFDYESNRHGQTLSGLVVRSLDDHWSIGAILQLGASTYDNNKFSIVPTPAVEYDVFPYSESTQRQLRILYAVGPSIVRYREETVYDKTRETRWGQSLSFSFELKRPWGTISTSLSGSHYFHDLSKNRLNLNGEISMRIFKGLNFNIGGGGSRVRDQLFLPKGGASFEEVLLRRRQLETGYNYFFMVGLSYTFGSVYSNVVNPRFGSSGGGGMSINISN